MRPLPDVEWGVVVERDGETAFEHNADAVLATASVGKLLLLGAVARRLDDGRLDPTTRLRKDSAPFVGDSGLWHLLDQPDLTILDACRLVGAVSDNLATNVLLAHIGLDAVHGFTGELGLVPMELLDFVRDERHLHLPPTLSRASARSLIRFMCLLGDGSISPRVGEWMQLNTDLSMVASAFGADPLAHQGGSLINKTGTDDGKRADVGAWTDSHGHRITYAVIANWSPADPDPQQSAQAAEAVTAGVLERMRQIGQQARDSAAGA